MTHNRESLRLSLLDLQQNTPATSNGSSNNVSVSQTMSVMANQAITTAVNRINKVIVAHQNDKCERLKKMQSITCSDSEDDSERRAQLEINNRWNYGHYDGVSDMPKIVDVYATGDNL